MPSSETIELRKLKNVVGSKSDLPSPGPRSSLMSLVKAIKLTLSGIPNLIHSFGALEQNDSVSITNEEIRSMESDGTYLFVGSGSAPAEINKIDLDTYTVVGTITLAAGENYAEGMVIIGDYVYVGLDMGAGNPAVIKKINKDSFEIEDSLTLSAGNEGIYDLVSEGSYLYAILSTTHGKVVKINIDTLTEVSTITLAAHYDICSTAVVYSSYLYIVTTFNDEAVISIDLSTFTINKYSDTPVAIGDTLDMCVHEHYLYIPTTGTNILKYDLDDLSFVGLIDYSSVSAGTCICISTDGTYLYAGLWTSPGKIILINIATATPERVITLEAGENKVHKIVIDGLYQYIGLDIDPGKILRRYIIPSSPSTDRAIDILNRTYQSGTHHVYPSEADPVIVPTGAPIWVKGAYVEVIPADTITERFYITGLIVNNLRVDVDYEFDIGIGAAASEVVIATDVHETHDTNMSKTFLFIPPIEVEANTRVAARAANQLAFENSSTVKIKYKLN